MNNFKMKLMETVTTALIIGCGILVGVIISASTYQPIQSEAKTQQVGLYTIAQKATNEDMSSLVAEMSDNIVTMMSEESHTKTDFILQYCQQDPHFVDTLEDYYQVDIID